MTDHTLPSKKIKIGAWLSIVAVCVLIAVDVGVVYWAVKEQKLGRMP